MTEISVTERIQHLEADNARLRHLLDSQGMPAELRHQIRNTLATVRAVVRRSAESHETVEDYVAHLDGRLDAILRVQSAVTRGSSEGLDLYSIVTAELQPHMIQDGKVRIDGPDLHLRPKAAELLALGIHELATNALKFGALGESGGRLVVEWRLTCLDDTTPDLALSWRENGGFVASEQPVRRGFGTELLEQMLPYQLNATTSWDLDHGGLRCSIALPLSPEVGFALPRPVPDEVEP